jgi:hypothetical protein
MRNEEEELEWLRPMIEAYLQNCPTTQWLNWAGKCPDPAEKKSIESVLFQNGYLRDLGNAAVKADLLKVFSQCPALMELVITEITQEVRTHTGEAPDS